MDKYTNGVRSTAAIAGHPLHPVFIVFPIAFLIGLFATDIVYTATRIPFWAQFSKWLALSGVVMGGVAAVPGLIDFLTVNRVRKESAGWIHFTGNVAAMIIALINTIMHWSNLLGSIIPGGLILSAITVFILAITGWYGGELAYRYGIGVLISSVKVEKGELPRKRAA